LKDLAAITLTPSIVVYFPDQDGETSLKSWLVIVQSHLLAIFILTLLSYKQSQKVGRAFRSERLGHDLLEGWFKKIVQSLKMELPLENKQSKPEAKNKDYEN
jgi:hypothetical protein